MTLKQILFRTIRETPKGELISQEQILELLIFLIGLAMENGFTQREIGEELNISQGHVSNLFNARRMPGRKSVKPLNIILKTMGIKE